MYENSTPQNELLEYVNGTLGMFITEPTWNFIIGKLVEDENEEEEGQMTTWFNAVSSEVRPSTSNWRQEGGAPFWKYVLGRIATRKEQFMQWNLKMT